jgi:dolichol-phosphate mannosyltransferase
MLKRSVTLVIPTFREADMIPHLAARLSALRDTAPWDLEVLLMDDDSRDGSAERVAALGLPWFQLITRTTERGLSFAVLDGLARSRSEFLVVMDADLSHPPEKIPELLAALDGGADLAVGSRFVEGGTTADDWGLFRWLNSRIATFLALPLTHLEDPMSGFFALRRTTFAAGRDFDPIGYKVMLELIIKCRCRIVVEVPIHFGTRVHGHSKLTFPEQLRYVRHLRRLYTYKFGTWSHFGQFLLVGLTGLVVNLAVLTLLLRLEVTERVAVASAIGLSMLWNFALNRRFSFSYARERSIVKQFFGFVAACAVGAVVNYLVTTHFWQLWRYKQLASTVGVLAGTLFNFVANRFVVFRAKHIKPKEPAA